jgi:NDP-sugar pyrophosphorylase family protein
MNAMLFAAGLGTRLKPLTNNKPKALIEVNGMTMLQLGLQKMENAGISKVVVNVHHFSDLVIEEIKRFRSDRMEVLVSDESDQLLDTGGGLLKARPLFDANSPVLLYNVDIVTTANLKDFIAFHHTHNGLASLMVKERPTSRHLLFNDRMELSGWENIGSGEKIITQKTSHFLPFGFQGIHILQPRIFDLITESGKFPIMELYLRLAREHTFMGFESRNDLWFDIGTPEKLQTTRKVIEQMSKDEQRQLF